MLVRQGTVGQTGGMPVDEPLYDAAVALIERRLPNAAWATAAALRLDDGAILTGICLDNVNSAAGLCAEIGPMCEAFTSDRGVTASICVNRSADRDHDLVLAPCGVCQERLALWGPEVEVGVTDPEDPRRWSSRRLEQLNPYYWAAALSDDAHWPTPAEHSE